MELTTAQNQKLQKLVKAGNNQPTCAKELNVTPGQLGMKAFCDAQVAVGLVAKAPATEASCKKLRAAGARWELIAAQTGLSVASVKKNVGEGTSVGRGRPAAGGKAKTGKTAGKTGVNPVARGGKSKAAPARARTRAERAAKSGNPS